MNSAVSLVLNMVGMVQSPTEINTTTFLKKFP